MKLTTLQIKNLRGIEDISILLKDFTTLIGQNNTGKSTVLRAIFLLCNGTSPDIEEFRNRDFGHNIEIIGEFENIKDWERNTPGVSGLISENKIILRYTGTVADAVKEKTEKEYHAYKRKEVIDGWSDTWNEISEEIKTLGAPIGITNGTTFKSAANKERLRQVIRDTSPNLITEGEYQWTNEGISIAPALQQAIPKAILIPAVRDASDETKPSKTSKTAFGELINLLIVPAVKGLPQYTQIVTALAELGLKVQNPEDIAGIKQINDKITTRLKELIDVKSILTLASPDIDSALTASVGIRIIDGTHDTPISLQGHGLQRTLIFALLEIIAERNSTVEGQPDFKNTIILFEEPELYMHPQMLRKLKDLLIKVSQDDNWQIVCSTHSPFMIDVADDPTSLIILKKNSGTKNISKCQLVSSPFPDTEDGKIEKSALRAALDFHPSVCEVFFADSTVLVEGDTEMALLKHCPQLLTSMGIDDKKVHDTSIVSCGGKWTIPAIARLLTHFEIPFKVVHDEDRKGLTDAQLAEAKPIHPFKANAKIASIVAADKIHINSDTIEDLWDSDTKSGKPYNAIVNVEEIVSSGKLNVFPALKAFITFCYS